MSDYIIYYTESNIICLIFFAIILVHDLLSVDKQEKQIKYDHALIAFMGYFVSDVLWAMVIDGVIPKNGFTVAATNFTNYLFMAAITYTWLRYAMAVEQTPHRNRPINKFAILFPFIVSTAILISLYIFAPTTLIGEDLSLKPAYNIFLIVVPAVNISAVLFYSLRKAKRETNPVERKKHIYIGTFPLLVIVGGLLQIVALPNTPIFCFSCAILMLIFNILSMETSISLDPLTGLNNRGQLMRVTSQKSSLLSDGKQTFIIMIDINDFKSINDTFGHAEGDNALIIIAESMKKIVDKSSTALFLGRYGGDEFIMIAQSDDSMDIEELIEDIRRQITVECKERNAPYLLSIGAGFDRIEGEDDSFRSCIQRADSNMYTDKKLRKQNGESTVIRKNA
ncbi:MAG: GGDEF domain-containing protein [Clostridia bacterium]|nr:GGDEF domain-containing protein [Clostridia bacterium]